MKAAGLQLLALGLGRPEHAERYCGRLAPSLTCFADTTNDAYYAFGLRQGTMTEAIQNAFNIAKVSAKAVADGFMQGKATGDAQMMPGTFIVDQQGIIRYAYYSQYAGDDPEIPVLLEAVRGMKSQT